MNIRRAYARIAIAAMESVNCTPTSATCDTSTAEEHPTPTIEDKVNSLQDHDELDLVQVFATQRLIHLVINS